MSTDKHPIYELAAGVVDQLAELEPAGATYYGVAGQDHRWPDLSPEGAADRLAAYRKMLGQLDALPAATDVWERLAVESTRQHLTNLVNHFSSGDHLIDLDSMASPAQDLVDIFDHMDKSSLAGWENICRRLETMPEVIEGYQQVLGSGIEQGSTVARRQVEAVVAQCKVATSEKSAYENLPAELDSHDFSQDVAPRLRRAIDNAKEAQQNFADWLGSTYMPAAVEADGVGRDRYIRATRVHLGTEIDPEETYAWGWGEVARLHARMVEVVDAIVPGGSIAEALEILKTDPTRAASTRQDFIDFMLARNQDALDRLDGTHFDVPPEIREFDVKLAAPGAPLGAYYVGPNEDFTRAGAVWWSHGANEGPFPLYDEVSTLYHEGFPGHHLQVGVQITRADKLTRLHRLLIWYPGLGEGWALYAERLVDELGFFEKPDYVFGFLAAQMLRACRVVIDIGSHLGFSIPEGQPFHPGEPWSFELGVAMLQEYATLDKPYAESEVTRYLGWPGQAIAYKVGERAILQVRSELEARGQLNLKKFHADLLGIGPVGLDLFRELLLA